MNITFKYIKKRIIFDQIYFDILYKYNKNKISKYINLEDIKNGYTMPCIRKLPIEYEKIKNTLNKCAELKRQFNKQFKDYPYKNYVINNRMKCIDCWIQVLENLDEYIEEDLLLPAFLKPKSRQKPKFLK